MPKTEMNDADLLAEQVRRQDPDRWLTLLFARRGEVPELLALLALNQELARIPDAVREPLMGEMRLRWWSDALAEAAAGRPADHPVLRLLAPALADGRLTLEALEGLVEARRDDLAGEPLPDLAAMQACAAATAGALNRLGAQISTAPATAVEAAAEVGTAWGLVGLLRATPYLAQRGRPPLPGALLAEVGLTPRGVVDRGFQPGLERVVRRIAEAADARLRAARSLHRRLPAAGRSALLLGRLAELQLRRLRSAGWNPFDARLAEPLPSAAWHLLLRRCTGRV